MYTNETHGQCGTRPPANKHRRMTGTELHGLWTEAHKIACEQPAARRQIKMHDRKNAGPNSIIESRHVMNTVYSM